MRRSLPALLLLTGCVNPGTLGWFVVVEGRVVDEDGAPITAAAIQISAADGSDIATVYSDADGAYSAPLYGTDRDEHTLRLRLSAEGYAEGIARVQVKLSSPELHMLYAGPGNTFNTVPRRLPTLALAEDGSEARVTGELRDASTNQPAANVEVILQHGWNADEDDPAADRDRTDADGRFRLSANTPGMYTIYAEEKGGNTPSAASRLPALLTAKGSTVQGMVSAPLEVGQTRAALLWPSGPRDLDLYVYAPQSDDSGTYVISEDDPSWPAQGDLSRLDALMERVDDNGDGPETAFIQKKPGAGDISFVVMNREDADDAQSDALASSGALLQIWYEGEEMRFYQVDPVEQANWWHPVEISAGLGEVYEVEQYAAGMREPFPEE